MNSTYKKEIRYTLVFSVLLVVCGHLGLFFIAIPAFQDKMVFGFPSQYIIPVIFGWIVLMLVVAIQAKLTNDLDDEIEALGSSSESSQ